MDYTIAALQQWADKIEQIALLEKLNLYEQEFELIGYKEMMDYMAYTGMPSRYPHWSFGKAYERSRTLYQHNLMGLPYELVINSSPCLAYLMKENSLLLQILTIAHVYGHNDFFKNNRMFKEGTDAKIALEMFKNDSELVRSYINRPSIGYEGVEAILNAAHTLRLQVSRMSDGYDNHENDILYFILKNGNLLEWERNLIDIVRRESLYFIPQIETKIINEGWATYWHYSILNKLNLPEAMQLEFIKRHNDVITPHTLQLNPYYLGFKILQDIEARYGKEKIFEVRELERDESFIRRYLTRELCAELGLFDYMKKGSDYVVEDVADENGWIKIKNNLCSTCGINNVPCIRVAEVSKKGRSLILQHIFDGRELDESYAEATLRHIYDLWKHPVKLITRINGQNTAISCDNERRVTLN